MTHVNETVSPQRLARIAGVLYLVIIVAGIWSEVAVRGTLLVAGDAGATAANILANEGLFRASFAADMVMALADVALAVLLFALLAPAGRTLALAAMAFRLIQAATIAASLVLYFGALLILNGSGLAAALGEGEAQALARLVLDLHAHGYDLGLVFFGVASLVLGYLIAASGYLPRVLGLLMASAGAVYLVGSGARFLAPGLVEGIQPIYVIPLVSELAFCLWLLVRGVNPEGWRARSQAAG